MEQDGQAGKTRGHTRQVENEAQDVLKVRDIPSWAFTVQVCQDDGEDMNIIVDQRCCLQCLRRYVKGLWRRLLPPVGCCLLCAARFRHTEHPTHDLFMCFLRRHSLSFFFFFFLFYNISNVAVVASHRFFKRDSNTGHYHHAVVRHVKRPTRNRRKG